MNYFDQTQTGRSVWWSWIFGTWVAMIIWVLGQTILIESLMSIAGQIDPELGADYEKNSEVMLAESVSGHFKALVNSATLIAIASIVGVIVTLIVSNQNLKTALNHDVFGESQKSYNSVTTILATLTVIAIVISIGLFNQSNRLLDMTGSMDIMNRAMGLSPLTYGLFLLTFPVGCFGLYLVQKSIHRRSIISLHTSAKKIKWWRIFEGFVVSWIVLGSLLLVLSKLGIIDIRLIFSSDIFWGFALTSLLLIPLQSGTEEIVFRGYFNQAFTHIFKNKWVAFAITSFAFMALHLSNPEALEGAASGTLPIVMSGYFFFGFAMCLLVWLDDGLETAIGVHAGNNCFAAIIVNYEGSVLPTPSIFMATPDAVKDAIVTIIYLAIIVAIIWWRRGGPSVSNDTQSIVDA